MLLVMLVIAINSFQPSGGEALSEALHMSRVCSGLSMYARRKHLSLELLSRIPDNKALGMDSEVLS